MERAGLRLEQRDEHGDPCGERDDEAHGTCKLDLPDVGGVLRQGDRLPVEPPEIPGEWGLHADEREGEETGEVEGAGDYGGKQGQS